MQNATTPQKPSCCPTDCWQKLFKGAVLGGIIIYMVHMVSWAILPWHEQTINKFENEAKVAQVLAAQAPVDGIYTLPFVTMDKPVIEKELVTEGVKTETTAGGETVQVPVKKVIETKKPVAKAKAGTAQPYAFVNIVKGGIDTNSKDALIQQAIIALLVAGSLTCILRGLGYGICPAKTSVKIGLIAALISEGTQVVWHHFPTTPALLNGIDIVLGVTLAGIAIAQFVLNIPLGGKGTDSAEVWH